MLCFDLHSINFSAREVYISNKFSNIFGWALAKAKTHIAPKLLNENITFYPSILIDTNSLT